MRRLCSLAILILALAPAAAPALELTNVRPSYGPLGATRANTNCMPGDVLFITYDIDGLKVDEKTGRASYATTLELLDAAMKPLFTQKGNPNQVTLGLGGARTYSDAYVVVDRTRTPGKHFVRVTVNDRNANETKAFLFPFEVVAPAFGFVGVTAPAVGVPGQHYTANFALVDMGLDAKKMVNVDIMMRVLDGAGKNVVARPVVSNLPANLPEEIDLKKENFVPMQFPFFLNRPGQYIIEILAHDKNGNKTVQLRCPLKVLDLGGAGN